MFRIYIRFGIRPDQKMDKVKDADELDYDVFISY